jgi:hypothetical protein
VSASTEPLLNSLVERVFIWAGKVCFRDLKPETAEPRTRDENEEGEFSNSVL